MQGEPARWIFRWINLAGVLLVSALALLGYQIILLLRNGIWTKFSLTSLAGERFAHAPWQGLDLILQAFFDFELSIVLIVLAMMCFWFAGIVEKRYPRRALMEIDAWRARRGLQNDKGSASALSRPRGNLRDRRRGSSPE